MSAPLAELSQKFSEFWNARNERERKQLVFAAAFVLLALIYMLLIEPAYLGRAKLTKDMPAMRLQAAEVQALAKEAATLANTAAPAAPEMTRESLDAAMARRGLKSQNTVVTGNLAKIQLSSVSFAGVLDWLDELHKSMRITVVDTNITPLAQTDMVNVTITLQQQKSE